MVKIKARNLIQGRTKPYYSLSKVKDLVKTEKIRIRDQALESAREDFGWELADILKALMKLQIKHFYKTEPHHFIPDLVIDYYKAYGLQGENVYTHFYIEEESKILQIDSFKNI